MYSIGLSPMPPLPGEALASPASNRPAQPAGAAGQTTRPSEPPDPAMKAETALAPRAPDPGSAAAPQARKRITELADAIRYQTTPARPDRAGSEQAPGGAPRGGEAVDKGRSNEPRLNGAVTEGSRATGLVARAPVGGGALAEAIASAGLQKAGSGPAGAEQRAGASSLSELILPRPRPAPPLKSFAQIPTEMMEEISRLREQTTVDPRGVPGRNDPTPVPGPMEAISPTDSPLDTAGAAVAIAAGQTTIRSLNLQS